MPIFPFNSRVYPCRKPFVAALLLMTLPLASCANKEAAKLAELEQRVAALEAEGTEVKREVVNAHLGIQNLDTRVEFLEREVAKTGVVVPYVPKRAITAEGMAEMHEGQPPSMGANAQQAAMPPVNAADSGSLLNPAPQSPAQQNSAGTVPPAQSATPAPSSGTNLASAPYSPNVLPYSPNASQSGDTLPISPATAGTSATPASPAPADQKPASQANAFAPQPLLTPAPQASPQAFGQPQTLPTTASPQISGQVPQAPASAQAAAPSAQTPAPVGGAGQVALLAPQVPQPVAPEPQSTQVAQVVQPAPTNPEQKAYDMGLQLYRTGRFAEAEAAFTAFMQTYPQSRLVPNALYWKGETHYARRQYTDAIFAFKDVQTRYPRDNKTPDSLLKTAMAYQKLGDVGNASLHLTVLFEDWPKSEAAQRARQMGLKP